MTTFLQASDSQPWEQKSAESFRKFCSVTQFQTKRSWIFIIFSLIYSVLKEMKMFICCKSQTWFQLLWMSDFEFAALFCFVMLKKWMQKLCDVQQPPAILLLTPHCKFSQWPLYLSTPKWDFLFNLRFCSSGFGACAFQVLVFFYQLQFL